MQAAGKFNMEDDRNWLEKKIAGATHFESRREHKAQSTPMRGACAP